MLSAGLMTIRITVTPLEIGARIKIDGDLEAEVLSELNAAYASTAGPVLLDLADLKTLDSAGEACLRGLIDNGATVDAASPYFRIRLGLDMK